MRRLHLIDKHHYPKYFPFDLVYTGTLTFKQRQQKNNNYKKMKKKKTKQDNDEMDVDQLADNLSRLTLPKAISFGHNSVKSIPSLSYKKPKIKEIEMTEVPAEKKKYPYPRKRGPKKPRNKQ